MADLRPFTKNIIFLFFFCSLATAVLSLPFAAFNGLLGSCTNDTNMDETMQRREEGSGSRGYCIQIGNGPGTSLFMPLMDQVAIGCQAIKEKDELRNGFNLVGISQGNLIARGVIEFCDDAPPVHNYISVGGPQAGQAGPPDCHGDEKCQFIIQTFFEFPALTIYNPFAQLTVAPTNYIKIPTEIEAYLRESKFLPIVNNEITRNATYKERFTSLNKLVLIKFDDEGVVVPPESCWFGYYANGANVTTDKVLPVNQTELYKEDWIGLKDLVEAGKVKFETAPGGHIELSDELFRKITPYLADDQPQQIAVT